MAGGRVDDVELAERVNAAVELLASGPVGISAIHGHPLTATIRG
jgi:hypothetical protein